MNGLESQQPIAISDSGTPSADHVVTTPTSITPAKLVVDHDHPWPGLYAYSEEFQAFFLGRTDEIEELLRQVKRRLLTVLYGVSGLGKSSLLKAGLFPRLTHI